jgi:hypothetical protein
LVQAMFVLIDISTNLEKTEQQAQILFIKILIKWKG